MLDIRVWDVGAALSIRIRMPNNGTHIIDAGASDDFSPAVHIADNHWHDYDRLDYLVISHFDADHVRDLPNVLDFLGSPKSYLRNKTVPESERYGSVHREYQKRLKQLDREYTHPTPHSTSPTNPDVNGGVDIISASISWEEARGSFNDASIVMSYLYQGNMIVFPGDIEPYGWKALTEKKPGFLDRHIGESKNRVLVAPHHGRPSGYSSEMIEYIRPSAVVVSDGYGAGGTDDRYYSAGSGLEVKGEAIKCISTKMNGRKLLKFNPDGTYFIQG